MAKGKKSKGQKSAPASSTQSVDNSGPTALSIANAPSEMENNLSDTDAATEVHESVEIEQNEDHHKVSVANDTIGVEESSKLVETAETEQDSHGEDTERHTPKEAREVSGNFQQEAPQEISKENEIEQPAEESGFDDDDDFGSFDEASFEEFEPQAADDFTAASSDGSYVTPETIEKTLDFLFPEVSEKTISEPSALLSETADAKFRELSKTPRLQPPNWTKLQLRHSLLLKLGIPINLDEISSPGHVKSRDLTQRPSVSEDALDWSRFELPDLESVSLTPEAQKELLGQSVDILSKIEMENISNVSELHLQKSLEEGLDSRLAQMRGNYEQLLLLSTLWNGQLEDLKASQNVYESVVQSMVGYNQKVQRNELLEGLRRSKTKRGKKTF